MTYGNGPAGPSTNGEDLGSQRLLLHKRLYTLRRALGLWKALIERGLLSCRAEFQFGMVIARMPVSFPEASHERFWRIFSGL